nr:radical SAM protein [Methanobacterium alcaliphilum]
MNPYLGCSFNCLYCYVNGSKYGEHVPSGLSVKINAPDVLYRQLKNRARKREYGIIALGSATDPYLQAEKDLKITREILKIIYRFHFPVNLLTKSTLILRDVDLLKKIDETAKLPSNLASKLQRGVILGFSFSTMNEEIAKIFEPAAPSPQERLNTMAKLKEEGFLVGACLMPVLPFLSDSEEHLSQMVKIVKEHGGDYVLIGGMTLFGNQPNDSKVRYFTALKNHFPELLEKTEALFRNKDYAPMDYQKKLHEITLKVCDKHGMRNSII